MSESSKSNTNYIKHHHNNIYVFCDITLKAAQEFFIVIDEISAKYKEIYIKICTYGGDLYAGLAMYNHLRQQHNNRITTINEAACHSAGTFILAGGDVRAARTHSSYLIHDMTYHHGRSIKLQELSDTVHNGEHIKDMYSEILCTPKFSKQMLFETMRDEKTLSSLKCYEYGLINHIW